MMKKISILGSTGSIGTSTLKVVSINPDKYRVIALSAGSNIDLLQEQIEQYRPLAVSVSQKDQAEILKSRLPEGNKNRYTLGRRGFLKRSPSWMKRTW